MCGAFVLLKLYCMNAHQSQTRFNLCASEIIELYAHEYQRITSEGQTDTQTSGLRLCFSGLVE